MQNASPHPFTRALQSAIGETSLPHRDAPSVAARGMPGSVREQRPGAASATSKSWCSHGNR